MVDPHAIMVYPHTIVVEPHAIMVDHHTIRVGPHTIMVDPNTITVDSQAIMVDPTNFHSKKNQIIVVSTGDEYSVPVKSSRCQSVVIKNRELHYTLVL